MARIKNVKQLDAVTHTGAGAKPQRHSVEGAPGLYIQVTVKGSKSWLLRLSVNGKSRELGLGGYPETGLKEAREKALERRAMARLGIDYKAQKEADQLVREAEAKEYIAKAKQDSYTFEKALEEYVQAQRATFRDLKVQMQWESPVRRYAFPIIGDMPVKDVSVQHILQILEPIWMDKNETAGRVRSRVELVLAAATVRGHRVGDNPARWAGNLKAVLPAPKLARKVRHMPALHHSEVQAWFADLRKRDGMGSRALEFLALTAVRSGNVRGATWDEIDLEAGVWEIPAERMKMSKPHDVPLPTVAVELLKALPRMDGNPLVFPALRGGQLSDMTLSATMRRMHSEKLAKDGVGWIDLNSKAAAVPHGLRSTARDWFLEETNFERELCELVLAHTVGGVEGAYRRGTAVERRRPMMEAWAGHLTGTRGGGKVIQFG